MAQRIAKVERRRRVRRPQDEVVQKVEEQDEDLTDDTEDEVEEVRPARRERRERRRLTKTVQESEAPDDDEEDEEEVALPTPVVDQTDDDEDEDEDEEEIKPVRRARKVGDRIKTVDQMAAEEAAPDPAPAPVSRLPKSVEILMKDAFLTDVLEAMQDGQTLLITRKKNGTWEMRTVQTNAKVLTAEEDSMPKLSGKEYWDEVLSPEYRAFYEDWNGKSFEERKAYAKKLKVRWESHESEKIEKMNLGTAVLNHLGIEKYKEQYRSSVARRRINAKS